MAAVQIQGRVLRQIAQAGQMGVAVHRLADELIVFRAVYPVHQHPGYLAFRRHGGKPQRLGRRAGGAAAAIHHQHHRGMGEPG